jgi:hypothetical protein
MREFLKIFIAFVMLMACYVGYVLLIEHREGRWAYAAQLRDLISIMGALQDYRTVTGAYPVLPVPDSRTIDLKRMLANSQIPRRSSIDLSEPDEESRYVSFDGKSYGLLFHFSRADAGQPDTCMIEFNARDTDWWGQPPKCRF